MRQDILDNRLLELKEVVEVKLETHVPSKYVIVDTETMDIWVHDGNSFRRATKKSLEVAAEVISREQDIAETDKGVWR